MFVRWQEYKSKAQSRRLRAFRKKHGPHRLRAILVETVRIDGKPHHGNCKIAPRRRRLGANRAWERYEHVVEGVRAS